MLNDCKPQLGDLFQNLPASVLAIQDRATLTATAENDLDFMRGATQVNREGSRTQNLTGSAVPRLWKNSFLLMSIITC